MTDTFEKPPRHAPLTVVLGGTGKTGWRVVERLARHGVPTRVADTVSLPVDAVPEPFVDATGRPIAFESLTASGSARDTAGAGVRAVGTVASR